MTKPYNILPMFRVNKIGKDYIIVLWLSSTVRRRLRWQIANGKIGNRWKPRLALWMHAEMEAKRSQN